MTTHSTSQAIYVHIGYPKTGTTSIQAYLTQNKKLLSQHGYHYLHSQKFDKSLELPLIISPMKCMYFMRMLRNNNVFYPNYRKRLISQIRRNLEVGKSILISNEAFIARCNQEEDVAKLRSFLSRFNVPVKIIMYIRRQDEFLNSIYSTRLRSGQFLDPLEAYKTSKLPYFKYLDYLQLMNIWSGEFGKDNIILKVYDKSSLINNDIVDDFMSILDLNIRKVMNEQNKSISINKAFDMKKIMFLENLYKVLEKHYDFAIDKGQKQITNDRILSKVIPSLEKMANDSSNKYSISSSNRMKILNSFEHTNIMLGQKYFGISGSPFHKFDPIEISEPSLNQLTLEDSFQLFVKILLNK